MQFCNVPTLKAMLVFRVEMCVKDLGRATFINKVAGPTTNTLPHYINHVAEVVNQVFPLERAVTPCSLYILRLGLPSCLGTAASGGELKVGRDMS